MARVHPEGWRELKTLGAAQREIETLALLADGLDNSYTIYHGVHWTRIAHGDHALVGEIDFAIVGPTGKVLLVEQKLTIALEMSQRCCVMGHGSIVFEGTPAELRGNAYIRKEWLEV